MKTWNRQGARIEQGTQTGLNTQGHNLGNERQLGRSGTKLTRKHRNKH